MRDPYATLGVRRNAGMDEIKAAWRNAAKSAHPDHNQNDPEAAERFAEIGRAYEVLKDPKLRSRYDQARREADLRRMEELKAKMQAANAAAQAEAEKPIGPETAEEVVDRLFGEGKARTAGPSSSQNQGQSQGQTQSQQHGQAQQQSQARRRTSAEERAFAARAEPRSEARPTFQTSGERSDWADDGDSERADSSKGSGFLLRRAAAPAAELVSALVKRLRGRTIEKTPDLVVDVPVTVAQVFRRERVSVALPEGENVKVAVPAGAVDGQPIRLREQGYRVAGAKRGDAVAVLRVQRDETFRIEGLDLVTTLSIDIQDAVLGCERTVESLDGAVTVEVPAWSGSDKAVRIAGRGLMGVDGTHGDLVVELRIVLFEKPDEKVTDLMRSMKHGFYL